MLFRPSGQPDPAPLPRVEWPAAFGLLVLFALALTWIAVGMGLVSPNAEAAGNNAMPLILLPLLSSAFVPVDSMPGWLAVGWCAGLTLLGYRWATARFSDGPR